LGEKGGKSREIPVRHDLENMIIEYLDAAGLRDAPKDTPLFQSALKKQRRLTGKAIHGDDIYRLMKRRLKDFAMSPALLSPLLPRHDNHRSAGAERPARGRAAPGRTRRPAHDQSLRPAQAQNQQEYRREDFRMREAEGGYAEPSISGSYPKSVISVRLSEEDERSSDRCWR
jgi:hypothetical protein